MQNRFTINRLKRDPLIMGILALLLGSFLFLSTRHAFPMESSRWPQLYFLAFLDLFLFYCIHSIISSYPKLIKIVILSIHWSAFAILIIISLCIGSAPATGYPSLIRIYGYGFAFSCYIAKFFSLIFLTIYQLIYFRKDGFLFNASSGSITKKRKQNKIIAYALLVGLPFFLILFFGIFNAFNYKISYHNIVIKDLPASFEGYKIAHISDVHAGSFSSPTQLEPAIALINEQNVDVIFFTGDIVNFRSEEINPFIETFKTLKTKEGIFTVLGNHDYGDYHRWKNPKEKEENLEKIKTHFKKMGWILLQNQQQIIRRGSDSIFICGVDNWSIYSRFPQLGDISTATKNIKESDLCLLLSHDPSHFCHKIINKQPQIDITFSGHTHGMQFGLEYLGISWSPAKYLYKYWGGLYKETSNESIQYLSVNKGLGVGSYPGRIGCAAEITIIELFSKEQ